MTDSEVLTSLDRCISSLQLDGKLSREKEDDDILRLLHSLLEYRRATFSMYLLMDTWVDRSIRTATEMRRTDSREKEDTADICKEAAKDDIALLSGMFEELMNRVSSSEIAITKLQVCILIAVTRYFPNILRRSI